MKSDTFKEYIVPVIVLVAICLVVTGVLAGVNSVTAPIIDKNAQQKAEQSRRQLLPAAKGFKEYTGKLVTLEEGKVFVEDCYVDEGGAGMVVTVKTKSFGGLLTEMIGIDADGKITGVEVTAHGDTPGLGTKAHTAEHLKQYIGLDKYNDTKAKKDTLVDYVSGATVSSNGVHYGVCAALEQYKVVKGGAR